MTTDSGKKLREFWILPQKGSDCEWTNLYPDDSWKSGTKPLIHVREVGPCHNCERLESEKKEYRHEAYVRQKINKQLDAENEKLKAQLAMCKEALKYYRGDDDDETSWMEPDQHLMYWTLWHDGDCVGGKVAAECLAKLEESEK